MWRCLGGVAVAAALGVLSASPVAAHIDPDPTEAPAGSEQSVGFTVAHGCDGSPTIELSMRLPEGVSSIAPEPPEGWTGAVDSGVVTFTGGSLADDVEGSFRVRMILPLTPDVTIYFPFVQRCEVGEIRWIDVPEDGSGDELDVPAPAMLLTAPLPGTPEPPPETTAAPTTAAPTTAAPTTAAPTTDPATTAVPRTSVEPVTTVSSTTAAVLSTTISPVTTQAASTVPPTSTTLALASADDDEEGASVGLLIAVIAGAVLAGAVAVWQWRRRR